MFRVGLELFGGVGVNPSAQPVNSVPPAAPTHSNAGNLDTAPLEWMLNSKVFFTPRRQVYAGLGFGSAPRRRLRARLPHGGRHRRLLRDHAGGPTMNPPMTVDLDEDVIARIDTLAAQRGVTREELLVTLVHSGLEVGEGTHRPGARAPGEGGDR